MCGTEFVSKNAHKSEIKSGAGAHRGRDISLIHCYKATHRPDPQKKFRIDFNMRILSTLSALSSVVYVLGQTPTSSSGTGLLPSGVPSCAV